MNKGMSASGILNFNRIHVTSDDTEFDDLFIQHLQEEGYDVSYLPWNGGGKAYRNELSHLGDDLELGEDYGIIAFGNAAADCLDHHIKPQAHLVALVTYYPSTIRNPAAKYPPKLSILTHLAGNQPFAPAFPSYTYRGAQPGFAEHDLDEFNKVSAAIAWTRTLGVLRKALKKEVELEPIKEQHASNSYAAKDARAILRNTIDDDDEPYVNHVPTMTGAIGRDELYSFYQNYFCAKNPPSLSLKLVSRTAGIDRVVDELILSFKHTQEMPWILPGVVATNKVVHVAMVSIVCVRGGKLYSEHVYWDQASVLVQVGLLDPKVVPDQFKKQGLKRLPIYGSETASKVLDEESQPTNDLIVGWKNSRAQDQAQSEQSLPVRPKQAAGSNANGGNKKTGGRPLSSSADDD